MKRRLVWTLVLAVTAFLCAVACLVLLVAAPILRGDQAGAPPVRVDVAPGTPLSEISRTLHAAGVEEHRIVFERYAVLAGFDRQIRAGEYDFVAGEPYKRILERLRRGDIVYVRVTIPEGYANLEIAALLARKLKFTATEFMDLTVNEELMVQYNIDTPSLEGYLFPDTYYFSSKTPPRQVIEKLLQRFFVAWTPKHEEMARARGMTRGQVLTLASIVEGEALLNAEMRHISAVYHNRLKRNMRLQADPTVLYALGVRRRVFYKDLEVQSPYNTYQYTGLPPGPINNPGLVAIEAAMDPAQGSEDLYFVAARDGSGRHVFSRTLRDHINAKNAAARR